MMITTSIIIIMIIIIITIVIFIFIIIIIIITICTFIIYTERVCGRVCVLLWDVPATSDGSGLPYLMPRAAIEGCSSQQPGLLWGSQ